MFDAWGRFVHRHRWAVLVLSAATLVPAIWLILRGGTFDNTPVFAVPAGHFFMMGDNRDNSLDSRDRSVGYVPFENFVGRAEIIFFSIEDGASGWKVWEWPWTVRWSRLFSPVK